MLGTYSIFEFSYMGLYKSAVSQSTGENKVHRKSCRLSTSTDICSAVRCLQYIYEWLFVACT